MSTIASKKQNIELHVKIDNRDFCTLNNGRIELQDNDSAFKDVSMKREIFRQIRLAAERAENQFKD